MEEFVCRKYWVPFYNNIKLKYIIYVTVYFEMCFKNTILQYKSKTKSHSVNRGPYEKNTNSIWLKCKEVYFFGIPLDLHWDLS